MTSAKEIPKKASASACEPSALSVESAIVAEGKANYRGGIGRRGSAIALAIATLACVAVLALGIGNSGNISSASSNGGSTGESSILTGFITAVDGKGIKIKSGDVTSSDGIILSGYSLQGYTTKLRCTIDSFPVYCDGGSVSIQGLPPGEHLFAISGPGSIDGATLSFGWIISP